MKERRADLGSQLGGPVYHGREKVTSGETFSFGDRGMRLFAHVRMDLEVECV